MFRGKGSAGYDCLHIELHIYTTEPPSSHTPTTASYGWAILMITQTPRHSRATPAKHRPILSSSFLTEDVALLSPEPEQLGVNLVPRNGLPALTEQYLVHLHTRDGSQGCMFGQGYVFVEEERPKIFLACPECIDLASNQLLGYALAPLPSTPRSDMCPRESSTTPTDLEQSAELDRPDIEDLMVVTAPEDNVVPEILQQLLDRLHRDSGQVFCACGTTFPRTYATSPSTLTVTVGLKPSSTNAEMG